MAVWAYYLRPQTHLPSRMSDWCTEEWDILAKLQELTLDYCDQGLTS
jgi:hypothetical protein